LTFFISLGTIKAMGLRTPREAPAQDSHPKL